MNFRIQWHKKALKELHEIPRKNAEQLILKAKELASDPIKSSAPLSGCKHRKLRAGDYRAILEVIPKKRLVRILKVSHRKNIYKKLKKS